MASFYLWPDTGSVEFSSLLNTYYARAWAGCGVLAGI